MFIAASLFIIVNIWKQSKCPSTDEWIKMLWHIYMQMYFAVVQLLSRVRLFVTPRTVACQASLSITISQSLLKLMSIESVMPSNHLILCHPLLLLPSIFPIIRVFFPNQSALRIRWPKYWSVSFSISPSNVEHSGLISLGLTGLILSVAWRTSLPLIPRSETSARKMGMAGILSGFPSYTTGHSAPGLGSSAPSVSVRLPLGPAFWSAQRHSSGEPWPLKRSHLRNSALLSLATL